jgi:hypothetical protein
MESLFVLADLSVKSALHRTAYSALPDAPVQPLVARRRPTGIVRAARAVVPHRRNRERVGQSASACSL